MEKIKYIIGGGVECPQCGSHNLTGEGMDWDEPLSRPIECNECGTRWVDILRPVDIQHPDGAEIKPPLFPIHQIFDVKWIIVIYSSAPHHRDRYAFDIHGPFVADKLQEAVKRLRGIHQKFSVAPEMYEIRITPEGQLFPVKIEESTCTECGNIFDDNPGKETCKTCQDWKVEGKKP